MYFANGYAHPENHEEHFFCFVWVCAWQLAPPVKLIRVRAAASRVRGALSQLWTPMKERFSSRLRRSLGKLTRFWAE